MPLPLIPIILGAIGGASAIGGIAAGIKGAVDTNDANDVNRRANWLITDAKNLLDASRKSSNTALEALGSKKLYILDKSVTRFVNSFEKLQNVELGDSPGLNELAKFRLDKQSFDGLKKMGDYAASVVGGAAGGALGGALAGFGAWSAAAAFGSASTGTAIAGLSGVAATNATLAFLGGGSLAAGGLGMAGGMAVLGGLVAGPALLIMGGIFGAAASAELDKARGNFAQAKKRSKN
jgi:hypothetical protein